MAADLTAYNDALKETWTQERLEKQFYDGNPFLEKIEKTDSHHIGSGAKVPLEVSRNGGYSAVPSTGSAALNAAGNVGLDQAEYDYTFHHQQVKIEHAALIQTDSKAVAVANVLDTEMRGATSALRKQLTRQLFMNGDALIAQCDTGGASTTVELLATGYGYDAIVRRWLYPGLVIDIGTTAAEDDIAADRTITSVSKSSSDPDIVISGGAVSTDSGDYISVANARDGTTSYEMNGLLNIVSTSATLGGITAAGEWKAASVDSTNTAITLSLLYGMEEAVMQESGDKPSMILTSFKQRREVYKQLQSQVRFAGDSKTEAGNVDGVFLNSTKIEAQVDCPDRQLWFLTPEDFLVVKSPKGVHWQSEFTGGKPLEWIQGTTAFGGMLSYPIQLGIKRRNRLAGFTALTA
jgi:hypothetical protein